MNYLAEKLLEKSPAEPHVSMGDVDAQNISMNIIRTYSEEAEYEYRESELRPNHLVLKIR